MKYTIKKESKPVYEGYNFCCNVYHNGICYASGIFPSFIDAYKWVLKDKEIYG